MSWVAECFGLGSREHASRVGPLIGFSCLWLQDKGIKCKVNIPDTVLFRYGQVSAWWFTNKVCAQGKKGVTVHTVDNHCRCQGWSPSESLASAAHHWSIIGRKSAPAAAWLQEGYVQRHASHAVTLEGIRKRFLTVANDDDANYSKFVALLRSGKGMSTGVWGPAAGRERSLIII